MKLISIVETVETLDGSKSAWFCSNASLLCQSTSVRDTQKIDLYENIETVVIERALPEVCKVSSCNKDVWYPRAAVLLSTYTNGSSNEYWLLESCERHRSKYKDLEKHKIFSPSRRRQYVQVTINTTSEIQNIVFTRSACQVHRNIVAISHQNKMMARVFAL